MIVHANAVSDPRAMVIESEHTLTADRAVMGSWWPMPLALVAVAPADEPELIFMEVESDLVLDRNEVACIHVVD